MIRAIRRSVIPYTYKIIKAYWYYVATSLRGVKGLIWHDGQILLVRHSYGFRGWKIPGGLRKKHERGEETLKREIFEEVGISIHKPQYIGMYHCYNRRVVADIKCYFAKTNSHKLKIDNVEVIEARWFSPDTLPKERHEQVDKILSMYKTHE